MERKRIGRPRSPEADAALLDAAVQLVREVGYDALALEAVAARAGVGKATLYRRWGSKEALVAAAIAGIVARIPVPDTGSVAGDVTALLLYDVTLYADPGTPGVLVGFIAAMQRSAAIRDAILGGFHAARRDAMRTVLVRAVARGELPAGADLELAMDLLHGAFFFRAVWSRAPVDAALARAAVDIVLRGLGASDGPVLARDPS